MLLLALLIQSANPLIREAPPKFEMNDAMGAPLFINPFSQKDRRQIAELQEDGSHDRKEVQFASTPDGSYSMMIKDMFRIRDVGEAWVTITHKDGRKTKQLNRYDCRHKTSTLLIMAMNEKDGSLVFSNEFPPAEQKANRVIQNSVGEAQLAMACAVAP